MMTSSTFCQTPLSRCLLRLLFGLLMSAQFLLMVLACNTDDNRCPANWHGHDGHCYRYFSGSVGPTDARTACKSFGADLVSITSEGEDTFVRGLVIDAVPGPVASPSFSRVTIGMAVTRAATTNTITSAAWDDGTPMGTYGNPNAANFTAGTFPWADLRSIGGVLEPKPATAGATCVQQIWNTQTPGNWATTPCTSTAAGSYVCEFALSGTNQSAVTLVCPPEYILFEGNCYKAFSNSSTSIWPNTDCTCQADGANLTSIHCLTEQIFIDGLTARLFPNPVAASTFQRIFMGLNLTRAANGAITKVEWLDGTPVDYGNPLDVGFVPGDYPWSNGTAYSGVIEPKNSTAAINGFFTKNVNTANLWAAQQWVGLQFPGGFICKTPGFASIGSRSSPIVATRCGGPSTTTTTTVASATSSRPNATTPSGGGSGGSTSPSGGNGGNGTTSGGGSGGSSTPSGGNGGNGTSPDGGNGGATTPNGGNGGNGTSPGGGNGGTTTPNGGNGSSTTTPGGGSGGATTPNGGNGGNGSTSGGGSGGATTPNGGNGGGSSSTTTSSGNGGGGTTTTPYCHGRSRRTTKKHGHGHNCGCSSSSSSSSSSEEVPPTTPEGTCNGEGGTTTTTTTPAPGKECCVCCQHRNAKDDVCDPVQQQCFSFVELPNSMCPDEYPYGSCMMCASGVCDMDYTRNITGGLPSPVCTCGAYNK